MSDEVYGVRCAQCLLSILGTDPRDVGRRIGEHRCDPRDLGSLTAFRMAAVLMDRIEREANPDET